MWEKDTFEFDREKILEKERKEKPYWDKLKKDCMESIEKRRKEREEKQYLELKERRDNYINNFEKVAKKITKEIEKDMYNDLMEKSQTQTVTAATTGISFEYLAKAISEIEMSNKIKSDGIYEELKDKVIFVKNSSIKNDLLMALEKEIDERAYKLDIRIQELVEYIIIVDKKVLEIY